MNYLAHLLLSHDEDSLTGNFIADFVRNKDLHRFPEGIRQGIALHRKIDHFTDNHPVVKKGIRRVRVEQGKYAPVVTDVFYDHILYNNWAKYTESTFPDFEQNVYGILNQKKALFPEKLKGRTTEMIAAKWLRAYQSPGGIHQVFLRMKKRTSFPDRFELATDQLMISYADFEQEFNCFFPELQDFVKSASF